MLFDQQIELFELRRHGIDVAKVEVHHLDQESGLTVSVSAPVSQHEAPVRFMPVLVPGYCRAFSLFRSQLRLSGLASLLGLLPPLAARSTTCRPSFLRSTSAQIPSRSTPLQLR